MDKHQLFVKLRERFFWSRTQGNQHYFVDLETGSTDLGTGHIMGVLISEGYEYALAKEATTNLKDKLHPLCKDTVYVPHGERVVTISGLAFQNRWRPPTIRPSEADSTPFLEHLLLALGEQSKVDYLLDLLALRYQKPNQEKPHSVIYLYQAEGGNGKSLFGTTLKHVFGESAVQIASEAKMNSGSKVQLWTSTLLIAEEANVMRGSDIYDTIKTYSGTGEIIDDSKHAHFKSYKIPASLIMLSNRAPNFLEPHDRRFFVSEWKIDLDAASKATYFTEYVAWLKNGGHAAVAGLLERRVINRDMYAPVPITEEKTTAMSIGHDSCAREILDALEDQSEARIFHFDDFILIFEKYGIKGSHRKHKMTDAGLKEHESRLSIGEDRFRPWHRKTDEIISTPGVGTVVKFDGQTKPIELVRSISNFL